MKYGIVIFPSKSLQDEANAYRKRYDVHYALIPPHITLISPFEEDDDKVIKNLVEQIHQSAKRFTPFELEVTKFSSFQPVNNVIYMKVEPCHELIDLQEALNLVVNRKEEYAFVPHITVGQALSDDEHSDVYGSLRLQNMNHIERIDRFHLLYQLDNGQWTVYETFRLGKEATF